ncbi:MAG TPA: CBS domain-containing protein [Rhodopila sp.]|jgi:CBS domain-containing protein|nr:CBS domain-containing protein [Rhodopila sp.]
MQAKDIMTTDVATVGPKQKIAEVIKCMAERHASGIPVVGADHKVCGIVTEGDLLRRAEIGTQARHSNLMTFLLGSGRLADEYVQSHTRAVEDIMTMDVATVEPDSELGDIVALMERRHVKRLPVVQDGVCIGIVSRADIVRAVGRALEAAQLEPTDDAAIRQRILDEISRCGWCREGQIEVRVMDGVVELEGVLFEERQRGALLVLAGNVPGVKSCVDLMTWVEPHTGMSVRPNGDVQTPPTNVFL